MKLLLTSLTLATVFAAAPPTRADEVTDWNAHMLRAMRVANVSPGAAPRLSAIVHAAIFDAINGIERRYAPVYVPPEGPRGASKRAAAIQAAYATLVALFPAQKEDLDRKRSISLRSAAPGLRGEDRPPIERGIEWGQFVAEQILAWRSNDGSAPSQPPFEGGWEIGQWRPTPPDFLPGAAPQFATMMTWVIYSPWQFRPAGPPALDSAEYAADYEEVRLMGSRTSPFRSPEESLFCEFWNAGTPTYNWNSLAARLSKARRYSLSENARLFAHLNLAMADAVIACFDAKYAFVFWRPVTAIPLGNMDGNDDTEPDGLWEPFITTPNHPDYLSGHSTISGAAASMLAHYFGDETPLRIDSDVMTGVVREFSSFSAAMEEVANARIYGGIHFRSACEDGRLVGDQVAAHVLENSLQRLRDR